MPETTTKPRRSVGQRFRDKRANGKKRGMALMAERKNIIREIHGLDPGKDQAKIKKLHEQAEQLLEQAKKAGFTLKEAYGLALVK